MARTAHSRISATDHVARRCGYQVIDRDTVTNEVKGLFPSAMRLRTEMQESYLSANWLEYFDGTKSAQLKAVAVVHRSKAKSPPSLDSGIAIINSGRVQEIGNTHRRRLAVRHTPNREDASYARISGMPLDNSDEALIASLAEEAYRDFILLKDVDALP